MSDTTKPKTKVPFRKRFARGFVTILVIVVAIESYLVYRAYGPGARATAKELKETVVESGEETVANIKALRRRMTNASGNAWKALKETTASAEEAKSKWFGIGYHPRGDVVEIGNHYVVTMDAPGISSEDVSVQLNGLHLVISGVREFSENELDEDFEVVQRERFVGRFERSFTLPGPIDPGDVDASLEDGVLKIFIAKGDSSDTKANIKVR